MALLRKLKVPSKIDALGAFSKRASLLGKDHPQILSSLPHANCQAHCAPRLPPQIQQKAIEESQRSTLLWAGQRRPPSLEPHLAGVWARTKSKSSRKDGPVLKRSLGGIDGIDNRAGDEACDKATADVLHELVRRAACPVGSPPAVKIFDGGRRRPSSILKSRDPRRRRQREPDLNASPAGTRDACHDRAF